MEIKSQNVNNTALQNPQNGTSKQTKEPETKFADELKNVEQTETAESVNKNNEMQNNPVQKTQENIDDADKEGAELTQQNNGTSGQGLNHLGDGVLTNNSSLVLDFKTNEDDNIASAMDDLTNLVSKLNQSEDNAGLLIKENDEDTDNNNEGDNLINNDFSIDNKDKLPQMMPNMNFGGDGQPFSSFMNNDGNMSNNDKNNLSSSAKELAEEAAILSTMAENIAIANKNIVIEKDNAIADTKPTEKIIQNEEGIKKIDSETNIVKEVVVKYDTVVMNEADVEVFANLVEGKDVNLNNLAPESLQKSVQVSKTLSDMLAKAMEDNKPVRIEFDNGISVIIKISRDGKLSADFLPSTQVAEAYLKENLPLLRQRFSEQGLDNEGLNQRERRNREREQDRRKGQDNE